MNKVVKIFVLVFFVAGSHFVNSQVINSVLSTGDWYVFSIEKSGGYKLDKSFLRKIGVNLTNLNPKKIKIYGNGGQMLPEQNAVFRYDDLQENAIFVHGEEDEIFDDDDYILFYASGPHTWKIDPVNKTASHQQNIYSEKAYYFLTISDSFGKRIQEDSQVATVSSKTIRNFDDFVFYEREIQNLYGIGRQWFGEDFSVKNEQEFEIDFKKAVPNTIVAVKIRVAAISSLSSTFNVVANSVNLFTISVANIPPSSSYIVGKTAEKQGSFNNSSEKINLTISYNNNGNPAAKSFLDYIEIIGKKELLADDNQFLFRSFEALETVGNITYELKNASAIFQIWDISNPITPKKIIGSINNNMYSFTSDGGELKEYLVLNSDDFYEPIVENNSKIANQNLHGLKDINYLIITKKELSDQANRLALYHQQNSGLNTKVVHLSEIYNEFSSGSPDITAIRDFIKYIYKNNTSADKKLKYVCFFGDATYDYKDRLSNNNNIVPVFESEESFNLVEGYVTDDYFVMLDDSEGSMNRQHTLEVATGRIPVSTVQQAAEVVDKILSYYDTNSFGDWRNSITLLADDVDKNGEEVLQNGLERIADSIKANKPIFNINKIYADAYKQFTSSGGERYPEVNNQIVNVIEKGTLMLNYFGHGGENGFADERILEIPQINAFTNSDKLILLVTITCEFSKFDNPLRISGGELMFWNKNGGAASLITTTREVFISTGQLFNSALTPHLLDYENKNISIAEALRLTKNSFNDTEKFFIYFFGDPAMKLAIPKPNVVITKMNGKTISQPLDTLKALSKVNFEGAVTDVNNQILTDFNGEIITTIYDKPVIRTTLDNDNSGKILEFDSQESKLFKGKASVRNGKFNFDFIVPKDVKFAYGKSKISFYAENSQIDKSGANFDIVAGGIDENAPEDTDGPDIKLYMNDESFIDGGKTNTSPNLLILLEDISGINTSISSIDHDIVAILDGDQTNPIILNDYYETELDDFTKGKVVFQLRNLEVGTHTIKVKAWDTYNNSSETTLSFVVVSDASLFLENVLNYPNPFINYTEFWFNHNKPNEDLEVLIQIFTVSGKLVKTIRQDVKTTGTLSRTISWNGLDDFGNKIGKGVYIYKLKVRAINSNLSTEKYEKLVIL